MTSFVPEKAGRKRAPQPRHSTLRRAAGILLNILLAALAVWILIRINREYKLRQLLDALHSIPMWRLAASLTLTVLGYAALTGYDYLGLVYLRNALPFRKVMMPSFIAYAVSNSAPVSILSGGGVRYRLFSRLGISARQAALLAGFDVLTYTVGLLTIGGIAFIAAPLQPPDKLHVPFATIRPVGVIFLIVIAIYLFLSLRRRRSLRVFKRKLRVPEPRLAFAQVAVSGFDWLLSSAALYVLLVSATPIPYMRFLAAFLLAQIVTLIAPVPGGLGVFEVIVLLLRPRNSSAPAMLAGLIGYRVIYYLIPLCVAGLLFVAQFISRRHRDSVRP